MYVLFQLKNSKADEFRRIQIEKVYFRAMQTYVHQTKQKRQNYETALAVCNANTYYNYYFRWAVAYQRTIELQMNTRIAILHSESKTKDNTFKVWYLKFRAKLADECQENRAEVFYRKLLVRQMFARWRSIIDQSNKELLNELKASVFDSRRVCLPVFEAWKKVICHFTIVTILLAAFYLNPIK